MAGAKPMLAHLDAACAQVERLAAQYQAGVERLEAATIANLSIESVQQWFLMYLRLVDLGVEIRRGEVRHRSLQPIQYACMHSTGTKGALHTGLSIDDANAIYQALEASGSVRERVLEAYFIRMDAIDRDNVGLLDARLNACLSALMASASAFYARLEVTGIDPHQELLVSPLGSTGGRVLKVSRVCFSPATCICGQDAMPWADFVLIPGAELSGSMTVRPNEMGKRLFNAASDQAMAANDADPDDIGLNELKRQLGFPEAVPSQDGDGHFEVSGNPKRRRVGVDRADLLQVTCQSPQEIYRRKCQEKGKPRKRRVEQLFVVSDGALELDLSLFGFHEAQDIEDILSVLEEAQMPIYSLNATNNFFDTKCFEIFCDILRLPMLRRHVRSLNLRCMALPQRPDFAALLRVLSDADGGTLDALLLLDLSYNTFFEDAVLCLNDLLDGLMKLETLSLESCFPKAPDPAVVEVAVVKDLVRMALVTCCHRLRSLNFGSNWMSFALLNSLFSAESALQELTLHQMTFFFMESPDAEDFCWTFVFQRQRMLKLSETKNSRSDFLSFFLDALTLGLASGTSQLKQVDLGILCPQQRKTISSEPDQLLDDRIHAFLMAAAENGGLTSLRVRYDCGPLCARCLTGITHLFRQGLGVCQDLDLSVLLPLSWEDLWRLIAELRAPQLRSLKLSVLLMRPVDQTQQTLSSLGANRTLRADQVFLAVLGSLTELVLEVKLDPASSKTLVTEAVVRELESAWVSLPTWQSTRQMSVAKRAPRKERLRDHDGRTQTRNLANFSFQFTTGT